MKLGLVQMTSTNAHPDNIAFVQRQVALAAEAGCDFVALPEVAGLMNRRIETDRSMICLERDDPFIGACRELARQHRIWIHTGSTPIIKAGERRFFNHSDLIDSGGEIVASYDKIHLFDMFPENGKPIKESKRYAAGDTAVIANTPWGVAGLSICYDLRFPSLYRTYAQAGAAFLFIPSAFTVPTGKAHWEVLLRARAIENGAYVIAAAQTGKHDDGRETYGHAMVVDPWGTVVVDMEQQVGLAVVDLDMELVSRTRQRIPSLKHDQDFEGP